MKKILIILFMILLTQNEVAMAGGSGEIIVAGAATATGAAVGYGAVVVTGMTAAGMMGGGAGIGAAAGPVGAAVGAIVGLAGYGVYKVFH